MKIKIEVNFFSSPGMKTGRVNLKIFNKKHLLFCFSFDIKFKVLSILPFKRHTKSVIKNATILSFSALLS